MNELKQSWVTLSCLQLSGALSLPVLMIGYYLGQHFTVGTYLLQLALGNSFLFCLSALYSSVIVEKKISTIEFAQRLFGPSGTYFCAFGIALSLLGWSAIQMHLLASPSQKPYLGCLLAGVLVYFLTRKDLNFLARATSLFLPLTILSLIYLLATTPQTEPFSHLGKSENFILGLMMVITAGSGLLFDLPTFYRHSSTTKDALISLILVFLVFLPLIEGLGIFLARHYNNSNSWIQGFINSLNLPSLLFLMISGIMGTCLNLYSATLIINRTLGFSYRRILLTCCLISSFLAMTNLEQQFSVFLELINLNAEVITILTLGYLLFKGNKFPCPNKGQKKIHQTILYLVLSYAFLSVFFKFSLFEDLFLDTAFITSALMSGYYFFNKEDKTSILSAKVKSNELS